jgi:hypothetical protein
MKLISYKKNTYNQNGEEFKKNIFSFNIENNLDFYKKENFQNQLSICKFFDNYKNDQKFNLHFYWQDYVTSFNEKHALSIKSAITTQNLNNCEIILWSNKDLSENEYLKPLLPFIQHKIWDMDKHLKDFGLDKLIEPLKLDRGYLTGDIFRILCMGIHGGIYCDLDVILLKDFSPLLDYEFTYFWEDANSQNNAIMRINYQSDFFKNLIQTIKNTEKINPNYFDLGEKLYKRTREHFKDYSILPMSWFDGDWSIINFTDNFKSNKKQLFYDDAFAWHWHNHWNELVEKNSKFYIYINKIENSLKNKIESSYKEYKFIYESKGNEEAVFISGSFNNWNFQNHKLKKINNNWEIDILLPIGYYQYKFLIKTNWGQSWFLDPKNSKIISDGLGNINSLIQIKNSKKEIKKLTLKKLDKIIYCFWLSKQEMNDKRKECLESIIKYSDSEVKLITLNNLNEYILKDHPLHEGFQYLSAVHKSDYLRSYFMHFYGGGYSDIKENKNNWKEAFKELDDNNNLYGAGYPAFLQCHLPNKNLNKFLNNNKFLIGNSAFIFKKETQLTFDWYKSIELQMDSVLQDLKKYPAQYNRDQRVQDGTLMTLAERNVHNFRKDYFYPLEWEEIQGQIFYPLIYKYKENISYILKGPIAGGNCAHDYGCHAEKE